MPAPALYLIVAMDRNGLIGRGQALPWRLPADLAHFKRATMGKPILMGRLTHESIGRPLPGRRNLVLSRDADYRAAGCEVFADLDAALAAVADPEVFVIGGAGIYAATLPRATRLYLTLIDAEFEGDTWFPAWQLEQWRTLERLERPADTANPWPMQFLTLERIERP